MASTITRIYSAFAPQTVEKKSDAVSFDILGAANIAPLAIVMPAKSHAEVIIQAVSAGDRTRAEEFAKKNGIPDVRDSYREILDDPNIGAVFIPLPNSLHFEWTVRSIRAGKHVLLEKPIVCAECPNLAGSFHNRFHPAVHMFLSFFNPADIVHVHTDGMIPWILTNKNDIEFNYNLSGGSMMMMGTYNFGILRMIFNDEPEECLTCDTRIFGDGIHDKCDYDFKAQFRFPNGGVGEATNSLRGSILWKPSEARKGVVTTGDAAWLRCAFIWHRIDVEDSYVIRNREDRQPIRKGVESNSHKAYTYKEAGDEFANIPGEDWWMSYRWQLEKFINRIKGRKTQYWISKEDSINHMRMLDMAYEKSGL